MTRYLNADNSPKFYEYIPGNLQSDVDTSKLKPAIAVPILMFHGVTQQEDSENTTQANFVADMEMLKKNGYQTITLKQMDEYMSGTGAVLPPKPIIITFDDGRKDSYYTTDNIFKKLNYTAAIFVATARTNKDRFFLTWDELKTMRDSGRWDIEAHGRNSHNNVVINEKGDTGKYLTSLIYNVKTKTLETQDEFNKRVEADYVDGIEDIKTNLGLEPKYFAIPLNEYGDKLNTNNDQAAIFNQQMVKKYFRYAFIEAVVGFVNDHHINVYNFKNTNPSEFVRIEPRNMSAETLHQLLIDDEPVYPELSLSKAAKNFSGKFQVAYGDTEVKADELHILGKNNDSSTQVLFGQPYWSDYSVEAKLRRVIGRSQSLLGRFLDKQNYISFGMTDNGVFLRQTINGVTTDLKPYILMDWAKYGLNDYRLVFNGDAVSAYFNNRLLFDKVPVSIKHGMVGVYAWSTTTFDVLVDSLTVAPIK